LSPAASGRKRKHKGEKEKKFILREMLVTWHTQVLREKFRERKKQAEKKKAAYVRGRVKRHKFWKS